MKRPDYPKLRALADLIAAIRPSWHLLAIDGALHAASRLAFPDLVGISLAAALDRAVQSPDELLDRRSSATPRPTDAARICRRSGRTHVTQLDHDCPLPACPHTAPRALDDARQAIHDARQETPT